MPMRTNFALGQLHCSWVMLKYINTPQVKGQLNSWSFFFFFFSDSDLIPLFHLRCSTCSAKTDFYWIRVWSLLGHVTNSTNHWLIIAESLTIAFLQLGHRQELFDHSLELDCYSSCFGSYFSKSTNPRVNCTFAFVSFFLHLNHNCFLPLTFQLLFHCIYFWDLNCRLT